MLREYRHSADRIIRSLGDLPIEDVTTEMLERWKGTLTASNRTVAKYLVNLNGIFERAIKVWGLPRTRVTDDREAFSPEDVWALVRAAGPLTADRRGEPCRSDGALARGRASARASRQVLAGLRSTVTTRSC